MKRRTFITTSLAGAASLAVGRNVSADRINPMTLADHTDQTPAATRKILIAGGNFATAFIRYMAQLTGKPRPKICYLPTASADAPDGILRFFQNCAPLNVEPSVQRSFIESLSQTRSWEEVLPPVDPLLRPRGQHLE